MSTVTDTPPDQPVVAIRPLVSGDAPAMAALSERNLADLERTGPPRPAGFYSPEAMAQWVARILAQCEQGVRQYWLIEVDGIVAGDISLHAIERGFVQSANVGYLVDSAYRGRGVATAALRLAVRESFEVLGLHRVDAGALTTNIGSQRVLEKAGFTRLGVARRFLFVDGAWRDHVMYELVGPDFVPGVEG